MAKINDQASAEDITLFVNVNGKALKFKA